MAHWVTRILFPIALALFPVLGFADNTPIKIGAIYGLTGPAAVWSKYGREGIELALEEVNQAGGINGHSLQVVFEDNQTIPVKSVSAFQKLVNQDKVNVIIGSVWDFITMPLIPFAQRTKTLLVSPTVMWHSHQKPFVPYFFTLGARQEELDDAIDTFFQIHPSVRSIGVVCWDDDWGYGYRDAIRRVTEKRKLEVSHEACTLDFGSDLRAEVTAVLNSKPDAVFYPHLHIVAARRLSEAHWTGPVLTTSNIEEPLTSGELDPKLVEGAYLVDWNQSPEFISKFQKKFGRRPIVEAFRHYDALKAVAEALKIDQGSPAAAIATLKIPCAGGECDFTQGSAAAPHGSHLYRLVNGTPVKQ